MVMGLPMESGQLKLASPICILILDVLLLSFRRTGKV